ncbi:MAG: MBL fold metallo-hydrolase [Patescibacteria group bacterium]|nr:MBL fold metallo-hydrolase [Patescibacteria group bacterium]
MHITWLGMSCFKIQANDTTIIINPYQDKFGLKLSKAKADILMSSSPEEDVSNNFSRIMGDFFQVDSPGEYEIQGTFIYGIRAGEGDQKNTTIFLLESEDIRVAHLDTINHSLTDQQLETMEGADVLLLPVSSLTPEKRQKLISQIEPRIIIPMYYNIPKCKAKLEDLTKFSKEMGGKTTNPMDKLIVKKKDLPQDETQLIVLKPNV